MARDLFLYCGLIVSFMMYEAYVEDNWGICSVLAVQYNIYMKWVFKVIYYHEHSLCLSWKWTIFSPIFASQFFCNRKPFHNDIYFYFVPFIDLIRSWHNIYIFSFIFFFRYAYSSTENFALLLNLIENQYGL